MELEPFQDTIPPRHQVESDESDDDVYPSKSVKRPSPKPDPDVVVHLKGPQDKRKPLLVSLDEAGRQWVRGVELEEGQGEVVVDDLEVASLFNPPFAEVTILCINVRLPIYIMHAVASTVISALRPTNVVIIDAYPVPVYISPSSSQLQPPPIRYLRTTAGSKHLPPKEAEPFRPPNIIRSPAASFLNILESSTHATPATLLLLPSVHIPAPAPSELDGSSGPQLQEEWEPSILVKLHRIACSIVGTDSPWSVQHLPGRSTRIKVSRRGDIGEGGMYI